MRPHKTPPLCSSALVVTNAHFYTLCPDAPGHGVSASDELGVHLLEREDLARVSGSFEPVTRPDQLLFRTIVAWGKAYPRYAPQRLRLRE